MMQNKNTRRGFTQINKHVVICPPCGESQGQRPLSRKVGMREQGKGVVNKATFLDNPPSALCATSPTLGGKSTTRGFTLIELLVVVLIIGILAAVALPQYRKAVMKSRLSSALSVVDAANKAMSLYVLENGYPHDPVSFTGMEKSADGVLDISCEPGGPSSHSEACHIKATPFYLMASVNSTGYTTALCFDPMCDYIINMFTNKEGKRTYRCMYLSDTEFSPYCQLAQELMPGEWSSSD